MFTPIGSNLGIIAGPINKGDVKRKHFSLGRGWPIRPSVGRVGLFVATIDVSSVGLCAPFLHNPQPATDTFRLSHCTVTVALSHPPSLSERLL